MCWIGAVDPYTCIERAGYDGCFPYAMYLPKSCLERFHAHALLQLMFAGFAALKLPFCSYLASGDQGRPAGTKVLGMEAPASLRW